MVDNMAS